MDNSVVVSLRDIVVEFDGQRILDGLNLDIHDKEFVTLLGSSGCGKTTLLRMIAGFNSIEGGDFYFGEKRINDVPAHKRDIGMVFQNYALYPHMTVYKNMAFGLQLRRVPKAEIDRKVRTAAQALELTAYLDRRPRALSGGQRQRLTIARALVRKPEVLILDDSASALDYATDAQLRMAIRRMDDPPTTFIVSQRAASVRYADEILVLDDGILAGKGTHDELLASCPVYQEIYYSQFPKEAVQNG